MTIFNELFAEKVYPKLTDGMHIMTLTGIGTPIDTKNSKGVETQYLPIRLEVVATGRPVVTNVFADSFKPFFISPIQSQLDTTNTKEWESNMIFIQELIENKTPLQVWVERTTYISPTKGEQTTTNYHFFEPVKKGC